MNITLKTVIFVQALAWAVYMNISLLDYQNWTGSQEELVEIVVNLEPNMAHFSTPLTKRTFVYYRGKSVISPANGKKYCYLHLVQCLAARKLASEGWTINQLVHLIPGMDQQQLANVALGEIAADAVLAEDKPSAQLSENSPHKMTPDPGGLPLPMLALKMLAIGVCDAFRLVVDEHRNITGNEIPSSLKRAMGLLGRLCVEEGKEDLFASIHTTLALCKLPFNHSNWPLAAFKSPSFQFSAINLIDIDHRCPTQDCVELASIGNEPNIKELFSFELLKQLCSSFGSFQNEAYKKIREFIGRNPITTIQSIVEFTRAENIAKVERFLTHEIYSPIGKHILSENFLYRCKKCGAAVRKVYQGLGSCTTKQCSLYGRHVSLDSPAKPKEDSVILNPHLMTFWFGPAIDELSIFDFAEECGYDARLYPDSDACDISIDGYDIGIDVKSYASPILLAHALNRSIGRLTLYNKKIVAVSDSSITKHIDYLSLLKKNYNGAYSLEFHSVSSLKKWMGNGI